MEREPHFLDEHVRQLQQQGGFESTNKLGTLWYNAHGDCVMYVSVNEGVVADRVDPYLTLYRSAIDNRAIGFQLKDIQGLMGEFDYDLANVKAEIENDEVRAVTLSMMLLKSYGRMPETRHRFEGYAEAMTNIPQLVEAESATIN